MQKKAIVAFIFWFLLSFVVALIILEWFTNAILYPYYSSLLVVDIIVFGYAIFLNKKKRIASAKKSVRV